MRHPFLPYREQQLSNLIHKKKYLKAIGLAITLEQPFKVLKILKGEGISEQLLLLCADIGKGFRMSSYENLSCDNDISVSLSLL